MRSTRNLVLLCAALAILAGCRFEGGESFSSATTPNPAGPGKGDEYGSAGVAESSGGTKVDTRYGQGAILHPGEKLNATYDQAAKGSGGQPGENPNVATAGHGQSNAPSNQPLPGELKSLDNRNN